VTATLACLKMENEVDMGKWCLISSMISLGTINLSNTKETGSSTKGMVREQCHGLTTVDLKDNGAMTVELRENCTCQTTTFMKVLSEMINYTVLERSLMIEMVWCLTDFSKMGWLQTLEN